MKTVLVIEDDAVLRGNLNDLLDISGYAVVCAANGREGVQAARETRPDVIVCDILMPGLDGYGVLQQLKQDPATASIPLIFLSAKADKTDRQKGLQLGASGYLTKPFTIRELITALEGVDAK